MPFIQQRPREFNRYNVEFLNVNQYGVCGLFKKGVWVYIGKGDIRQRLLDHLNGDNLCILRLQPTHWVDEVYHDEMSATEREKQLILELSPICNEKIG